MPDSPPDDSRDEPRLCQACHESLAAVRVTWFEEGREVNAYLCAECARKGVD